MDINRIAAGHSESIRKTDVSRAQERYDAQVSATHNARTSRANPNDRVNISSEARALADTTSDITEVDGFTRMALKNVRETGSADLESIRQRIDSGFYLEAGNTEIISLSISDAILAPLP